MDLGTFAEGVAELSPEGRLIVKTSEGKVVDIYEKFGPYIGKEVRFILTPLETITAIAAMLEGNG